MSCGPFLVKRGRSQEKRYGCLFTCLAIRAVHLEVLQSMDADSFMNALVRFTSRRGSPRTMRSDNGTNFTGAHRELLKEVGSWHDKAGVQRYLQRNEISWEFNPPCASHMGGCWERMIRTTRKVLSSVVGTQVLDDERLRTLFCEVESIINSRPLTKVSDDPKDLEPLTPNHLLMLRQGPGPLPGEFSQVDSYRKRWRHVQFLADRFWARWSREYLQTINLRQKWLDTRRNLEKGEVVLLMDENSPRKEWPLGRVLETKIGSDELVRSATVKTATSVLIRPVTKLCLLESVLPK